ncbi:MAG: hypothetical protein QM757_31765 [Paludibaculum sp.]
MLAVVETAAKQQQYRQGQHREELNGAVEPQIAGESPVQHGEDAQCDERQKQQSAQTQADSFANRDRQQRHEGQRHRKAVPG